MIKDVIADMNVHMDKTIESLRKEYQKVRTGRASTALLDDIKVDSYGTLSPLNQVASLAIPEARTITIQPWDSKMIGPIEKAIMNANLGLTPANDGKLIRLVLPPLTEERRKDIAKQVKTKGEEHKVTIRNERRDANERLKGLLKDKKITEDENKRTQDKVQKETDAGVAKVDELVAKKEKEVLEV